jgi:hypothetical protein
MLDRNHIAITQFSFQSTTGLLTLTIKLTQTSTSSAQAGLYHLKHL